jgi:hypothetical protein
MSWDDFWLFLDRISILWANLLMFVSIVIYWRKNDIKQWLLRPSFGRVGLPTHSDIRFDALLLPISKAEIPCWLIDLTRPDHLALIATPQSLQAARQVEDHARQAGIMDITLRTLEQADDTATCRDIATTLLQQFKTSGCEQIGADTTGGKVPMSLGVFMAAEELGATTLYVSVEFDSALKRPKLDTAQLIRIRTPSN